MPYLILDDDNSILDINETDETGSGVEVTYDEMTPIVADTFGHRSFMYTNGAIVFNKVEHDWMQLNVDKAELIKSLVDLEIKLMAQERIPTMITAIKDASSQADLDLLR